MTFVSRAWAQTSKSKDALRLLVLKDGSRATADYFQGQIENLA